MEGAIVQGKGRWTTDIGVVSLCFALRFEARKFGIIRIKKG